MIYYNNVERQNGENNMTVRDLFTVLEKYNTSSQFLGLEDEPHSLRVYFDDYESQDFNNYQEFIKYVNAEYIPQYVRLLLNTEVEREQIGGYSDIVFVIRFLLYKSTSPVKIYVY